MAPISAEDKVEKGVKVVGVVPELTADKAGIKAGDIIIKLNSVDANSTQDIASFIRGKKAGLELSFKVIRNGKTLDINTKLLEKPKQKPDGFKVDYDQFVSKGKRIRVIATYPEGNGPFPTVFVIGGIGSYSIDGEYRAVPYGNILEPLAKSGYAIIRTEKPGQGDAEGPAYIDLMFDDELDSYVQSLRHMKSKPYVDKNRIAIFGHSMGGAFGPLVASQEPVKGVIACAGMTKTWVEYCLENSRRQMILGGASDSETDQAQIELSKILHYTYNEGLLPAQIKAKYPEMKSAVDSTYPDGKTYSGVNIAFFQQLAKKNLPRAWEDSKCKVLSMWGENDFISTGWDNENVAKIVNRVRPGSAQYKVLPQSDHGFFQTTSFEDSMRKWGRPGNQHNPVVNQVVETWLKENI